MKQKKTSTGYERNIRRTGPAVTHSITSSAASTSSAAASPGAPFWEFVNDEGEWEKFDRISNKMIEGSADSGRTNVTLSHPPWSKVGGVVVDFIALEVKFIKSDDGKTSPCRRTPPLVLKLTASPTSTTKIDEEDEDKGGGLRLKNADAAFKKATGAEAVKCSDLPSGELCPICLCEYEEDDDQEIIKMKRCVGHYYHLECIVYIWKDGSITCPICSYTYGAPRLGNMPKGTMNVTFTTTPLNGVTDAKGSIQIDYNFPSGIQGPEHYHPGVAYEGTSRCCYLPDNNEGKEVLRLLKVAWERRLLFTIGTSVTTGSSDQVIWNGIHHKTSRDADSHGYPDPTYLARVTDELKRFGVE